MSPLRRLWAWWTRPPAQPEPPPPLKRPSIPPHDAWLKDLLEDLRTPENEGDFRRADVMHVLTKQTPAKLDWLRGFHERTDRDPRNSDP
jgi:hypothetical protein